jgi:hypothetical protein
VSRSLAAGKRRLAFAAIVLAGLIGSLTVMSTPVSGVAGFGDVGDSAFYTNAVQWMVDNDITTGTSATCFSPGDPVTRGQAAAFMWRMEGEPSAPAHSFTDIVAGYQQQPVSWMAAESITTGTSPTTYAPDAQLTRGQLAALLHRLAGNPTASGHPFNDITTAWQQTPVAWMVDNDITTGTSPTTFAPNDTVTRGQLATFFHRYKAKPAVTVDPAHPTNPTCPDQVPGPTTTTTTTTTTPPTYTSTWACELRDLPGSFASTDWDCVGDVNPATAGAESWVCSAHTLSPKCEMFSLSYTPSCGSSAGDDEWDCTTQNGHAWTCISNSITDIECLGEADTTMPGDEYWICGGDSTGWTCTGDVDDRIGGPEVWDCDRSSDRWSCWGSIRGALLMNAVPLFNGASDFKVNYCTVTPNVVFGDFPDVNIELQSYLSVDATDVAAEYDFFDSSGNEISISFPNIGLGTITPGASSSGSDTTVTLTRYQAGMTCRVTRVTHSWK